MSLAEILALFRIGMATWEQVADAIEAVQSDDGFTLEQISSIRNAGNEISDALGESIARREASEEGD